MLDLDALIRINKEAEERELREKRDAKQKILKEIGRGEIQN